MTQPDMHDWTRAHIGAVNEARERACEAAIQTGRLGVLEIHYQDGAVGFEVTAQAPFGEIHVRNVPHRSEWRNWIGP